MRLWAAAVRADVVRLCMDLVAPPQMLEWKFKCESVERRDADRREADAKKHKDEVGVLLPSCLPGPACGLPCLRFAGRDGR